MHAIAATGRAAACREAGHGAAPPLLHGSAVSKRRWRAPTQPGGLTPGASLDAIPAPPRIAANGNRT